MQVSQLHRPYLYFELDTLFVQVNVNYSTYKSSNLPKCITPKKASSSSTWFIVGRGGLILLLQIFWNCPFEHLLQTASFAGHLSLVWVGDFPHLVRLEESCLYIPELLWGFLRFVRWLFLISLIVIDHHWWEVCSTTDCWVFMALLCLASVTALSRVSSGSICSFWAMKASLSPTTMWSLIISSHT